MRVGPLHCGGCLCTRNTTNHSVVTPGRVLLTHVCRLWGCGGAQHLALNRFCQYINMWLYVIPAADLHRTTSAPQLEADRLERANRQAGGAGAGPPQHGL